MNRVPTIDYRVIEMFLTALNCSRALTVLILLRNEQYEDIVNLTFNPLDYNDQISARDSLAATELLRKHEDLPTGLNLEEVAIEGFFKAEQECLDTNNRLRERNAYAAYLYNMQRKIADILGPFNPEDMVKFGGWGPGSTVFIKRREATTSNKFRQKLEFTPALYHLYTRCLAPLFPHWQPKTVIIEGNKVITVPKNAKTDRVIAVEPSFALYLQKGIGTMIRRGLKRFGVDLNTQSRNQDLACEGSVSGRLATIDFSAASDTISYNLVLDCLPTYWFAVLDVLRSPRGYIKCDSRDELITYEKFSSMGNGFTFELESLIFLASALAVCPLDHELRDKICIYGDDLIIPSDLVDEYSGFIAHLGFKVNARKSYSTSYYRESCGRHFWGGVDITPIYLRRYLDKLEKMRFHNRVVELSRRTVGEGFRDTRFRPCINFLWANRCKELTTTVIPIGYGDLGYIKSFDEISPIFCRRYQRGFYTKFYVEKRRSTEKDDDSYRLAMLYHLMKRGDAISDCASYNQEHNSLLGSRYVVKRGWVPDWASLGSWI